MTVQLHAPVQDFVAHATSLKDIQLSAFRGFNVVLYFYPKDQTPGCSIEANDFAAHHHQFKAENTFIIGISKDSLESHERFKERYSLPFELISDSEGVLCDLFDVIKEKETPAGTKIGMERSTFLVDKDGNLAFEWRGVKVNEHVQDVLATVTKLNNGKALRKKQLKASA